ncbi:shikimate dehydrogenase [Antricoccus suffuscus]|uniref:Shikimate dehydrogenase n=1 Tax=Antricoccus suffuscus TaxID=1629062 RepID=A0A2T0ZWH0_9ACTN|nr:shikimate dehydrogenase [Antricoccus suffuscus]PRZ40634.1 shikimate dehydrogenase [Antricoccus suffuscus]
MPDRPVTTARACAVVGSPIAHSLSPVLHRAAYADLGLDGWTYGRIDVPAGDLASVAATLAADGLGGLPCGGLSVTMPGKKEALALAVRRTDAAVAIGAANTLVPIFSGDSVAGWTAYNTDVDGVLGALGEVALGRVDDLRVLIVGAGGTAAAAVAATARLGAHQAEVVARSAERAQPVVAAGAGLDIAVTVRDWTDAASLIGEADVVISTVPQGAADHLAHAPWRRGAVLLDAVYAGGDTALMSAAAAAGVRVAGGRLMLLHQAVEQVRLMTGRDPDLDVMRAALLSA